MMLNIHPSTPSEGKIEKVIECLKEGGIIIFPTDTIYSFGCDINNKNAIERLAKIRGKSDKRVNFSIICHDLSILSDYTTDVSQPAFKMMKKTLPGAFTYILKSIKNVPKFFDFNKPTIGIRVPDNNITRDIADALGRPLVSTSVVDETDEVLPYITDPEQIYQRFGHLVDLMVNGGPGDHTASTVVDLSNGEPLVIRQGKGLLAA